MLKNYFLAALRHLRTNKAYSFLNVIGLAIGMACAALIFLWVENELNFDNVNTKKDRLYYVLVNEKYDVGIVTHASTPGLMAPVMQKDIPGIASTCRVSEDDASVLFSIGDKSLYASGRYAEPSVFSMFTLPFVQGNAKAAFSQLYSLVVTQKTARKFFGDDKNVLGKTVRVNNKQDYVITGVLKDLPENTSLRFEWLAPFEIWYKQSPWAYKWENNCLSTYVELEPGVNPATVNKQLYNYVQQHAPSSIGHVFLFNMNDWHLRWAFDNGKQTGGGRIEYVHLFSIIAWIILIIACINFMNLATARSEKRAREVGVRKVLGAGKRGLVVQFIGEALIMATLSAVCALFIISLALPAFNILVQENLSLGLTNPFHILALLSIIVICGLVAGSYPSLYLSSFNPVFVLKGLKLKSGSAAGIRKGLVVAQFTISLVLIIATIIIYQQIQHVKSRNLGFDKDNLLEVDLRGNMGKNFSFIRQDLLNTGVVENAALSDHPTLYGGNNTNSLNWAGKAPGSKVLISGRSVTPGFFAVSGMHILEGRDLQESDTIHSNGSQKNISTVITASLAKMMGNESAIGKSLYNEGDSSTRAVVVGVVNDYVYGNMYDKPDPVLFTVIPSEDANVMYVRVKPRDGMEQVLAKMEAVIKKDNPAYPFGYRFVDDQFNQLFINEALISKLSRVFAALAILISCLGLFGLAAYTAERRTKEIGIRKVLGASVPGIAGLLSKEFVQMMLLSCLIAFPVAWWAMSRWLQGYAYRITINAWVFLLAGVSAMLIAVITISFQSVKAALANPVKSLRSE
ncbi:MAG TPA: ABC transporter permease [Chitinophagaceae bacterium]|jgi:predicted permease